ncbi:MAG: S8 family serine peptidase [Chloroflexaceae bacterium]|nr:S8 family serine peptidase [Chloroflexaceae bacterium]
MRRIFRRFHPFHRFHPFYPWILLFLALLLAGEPQVYGRPASAPAPTASAPSSTTFAPAAASVTTTVLSEPVSVRLTLGTRQQVPIIITNSTSETFTPVLYEALPVPPEGVAPSLSMTLPPYKVSLPDQSERVDPQILQNLAASPDGQTDFFVFVEDQPDLSAAYAITDWAERGRFVYETLKTNAEQSQRPLREWLEVRGIPYRSFWMINALEVHGTENDLRLLEAHEGVALLRANYLVSLDEVVETDEDDAEAASVSACQADDQGVCWNIQTIGASRVWNDFGVSGQGITIATMDSGVRYDHPALVNQYRGLLETGGFDHAYNWFDPYESSPFPMDAGTHGTHVMGTLVGRGDGTAEQPAVGVAPGARWIAARGCSATTCPETDLLASAEWLLAPTDENGENPRPDLRPHIINNSWASGDGGATSYLDFTTAWRAAGIFPVFAAGNLSSGIICGSIASPADYANVVGVGATDQNDQIAYFSRVGPTLDDRLKPDITAPGYNIASTFSGSGLSYGSLGGTSMAAPHVSGAVALLWSANPSLIGDYETTYSLLTQQAKPRLDTRFDDPKYAACSASQSPNNIYGYGVLDIYAAIATTKVDVPWLELTQSATPPVAPGESHSVDIVLDARRVASPGTYEARVLVGSSDLSQSPQVIPIEMTVTFPDAWARVNGQVYDESTGEPLPGATVEVADGPHLDLDEQGNYEVILPVETSSSEYLFVAEAENYVTQRKRVALTDGTTHTVGFPMVVDEPRIQVDTSPVIATLGYQTPVNYPLNIQNAGTQPLQYALTVSPRHLGVWRSDEDTDQTQDWISMPADATRLELSDDSVSDPIALGFTFPFSGSLYSTVRVGANGILIFGDVFETRGFEMWCPPDPPQTELPETDQVALMPFRVDLNPEQGGTVSYARVQDGFVVTFAEVPLFDKPDTTFTFQVLLMYSGRIQFNYQHISERPSFLSVGVQLSQGEQQLVGCGTEVPVGSGLTLAWYPQPDAQTWLDVTPQSEGTIAPKTSVSLNLAFQWVFPAPSYEKPYQGEVTIASNDAHQPLLSLPVEMVPLPLQKNVTVSPDQDASMTLSTTGDLAFSVAIAAGTFGEATRVEYTEAQPPFAAPTSATFAGHAFALQAYQQTMLAADFTLVPPITIVMTYDDSHLSEEEERSLALYYRATKDTNLSALFSEWEPVTTQSSDYSYDIERNQVTVVVRKLGYFALFSGPKTTRTYLPLIQK